MSDLLTKSLEVIGKASADLITGQGTPTPEGSIAVATALIKAAEVILRHAGGQRFAAGVLYQCADRAASEIKP